MRPTRLARAALPLAALLLASALPAAAQTLRTATVGVGVAGLELDDLNERLAAAGYPAFATTLPLFSAEWTLAPRRGPVLGLGFDAFLSPAEETDDGARETSMGGGWGRVSVGWPVAAGRRVRVVPTVGAGVGGMSFTIRETGDVGFGEVLEEPGRSVQLSTTVGTVEAAVQTDVRLGRTGARGGVLLGLRVGYVTSGLSSGWSEIEGGEVSAGPDGAIRGPYARLTLGGWRGPALR